MDEKKYIPHGYIYKYTAFKTAQLIVASKTFKFTNPIDFNDPFDCNLSLLTFSQTQESENILRKAFKYVNKGTRRDRRELMNKILNSSETFNEMYNHIVREKINKSGVTCFSKRYDNTLMWSHYADRHKGICLEFNTDFNRDKILEGTEVGLFVNVNYEPIEKINYNKNKREAIIKLFSQKSSDWRYEEEVRLVVIDKKDIIPFHKELLTGVIFGCRVGNSQVESFIDFLQKEGFRIRIRKALKGDFKLEFKTIT